MEYVIGIITVLVGGVLYLFNQNQKLKSDKKISDSKIEDAKLETKQQALIEKSSEIQSEINNSKPTQVNQEQSAEDFWKNRK
jgi:hypothetical protein